MVEEMRDIFAALAMQGMLAHSGVTWGEGADLDDEKGAERSYKIADAMIRARDASE